MQGGTPVLVLNTNTKRETGHKAQIANIQAAKVGNKRARFLLFRQSQR